MIIAKVLFWISLVSILVAYLLYPLAILTLRRFTRPSKREEPAEWPEVAVVFAAYNEEGVIETKIQTVLESDYPVDKLQIWVGSDCSTDQTNAILRKLEKKHPQLRIWLFKERRGKSSILNDLISEIEAPLLLLTDANILFTATTIRELVMTMQGNPDCAAVGGQIQYVSNQVRGIGAQENTYLSVENQLKSGESKLFKICLGLEGGCYLAKREHFPLIPTLFFMEDFYVTMHLLSQRHEVLFQPRALVYEDLSTEASEEYRRKVRISIGNFQNLGVFKNLIAKRFWPLGISFLCHKVLRWFTPFFMILLLVCEMVLFTSDPFYALFSGFYMMFIAVAIFGILFSQRKAPALLKYAGHFLYMNIALLDGFVTYLKGVNSNAWQPTKRNKY